MTASPAYEFSADPARLDAARVHRLLADHASWAAGRSRELQDAAIAGSRNYGVYERATGTQVGYARVVTDAVTFAWLADVVVDPAHRRLGVARLLVTGIVADLAPMHLKRVVLVATAEGRRLYEGLGWKPLDGPDRWLVLGPTEN